MHTQVVLLRPPVGGQYPEMQKSRTELNDTGMSASASAVGVTAAASASMSSASSSGTVKFRSSAAKSESESKDPRAMSQTYVRMGGREGGTEGRREGKGEGEGNAAGSVHVVCPKLSWLRTVSRSAAFTVVGGAERLSDGGTHVVAQTAGVKRRKRVLAREIRKT